MPSDRDLIRRGAGRDQDAFAVLFDRHATAVFKYAFSLTGDVQEAQELVQETFLTAWTRLSEVHLAAESMLPWLIVTCRHHGANRRRRNAIRVTVPLDENESLPSRDQDALDRIISMEELEWVLSTVSQMSERDRRIVEMCLFQGQSYKEAATRLGLNVGSVTKRVSRIRSQLRKQRTPSEEDYHGLPTR